MKIIHMLMNLQKSVVPCLYMEHTFWRGRQMQNIWDMEFIAGRSFTKQRKQLFQANDKLYEAMELHTKNIRFSPEHRDHQADIRYWWTRKSIGMEKMSCWGNIGNRLYLQTIIFLHQLAILKDTWKAKFLDFMKLERMIQLWLPQIYLETLSIYVNLKMESEEFVAWFWPMLWCGWSVVYFQ